MASFSLWRWRCFRTTNEAHQSDVLFRAIIQMLKENGFEIISDEKGACWFFERYGCPRFTTPDEKGNIILDICHYIKN